jgi:hypothetical protein
LLVCALPPVVQAQTLSLLPSTSVVPLGSSFSLDLRISGLGNGTSPSLGVYDIDLLFNPGLVSFSNVTFSNGLDVLGLGSVQVVTPTMGSVNLYELSLDLPQDLNLLQPASFTLATVSFQTLALGTAGFSLFANAMGDADGNPLTVSLQGTSVAIVPVPEPSAYVLMLAGLAVLGCARLRERSARYRRRACA